MVTGQEKVQTGYKEKAFCANGSEALAQVVHGSCACPVPGDSQGQAGQGSKQLDLAAGDPAYYRGIRLGDLLGSLPTQIIV